MIQDVATLVVVALAALYLVWKLGWRSRSVRRRKAPDVPLRRLRRGKNG